MAKLFNSFTLMVILALASRVVLATEIIEEYSISPESPIEEEAAVPAYDEEMPPEPSPEELQYLHGCVNKMTEECAEVVFGDIFEDLKNVITYDCCRKLVVMGRQCHDSLVKVITEIPKYKGNASIIVPRSVDVWDNCIKVAGDISPTPSTS